MRSKNKKRGRKRAGGGGARTTQCTTVLHRTGLLYITVPHVTRVPRSTQDVRQKVGRYMQYPVHVYARPSSWQWRQWRRPRGRPVRFSATAGASWLPLPFALWRFSPASFSRPSHMIAGITMKQYLIDNFGFSDFQHCLRPVGPQHHSHRFVLGPVVTRLACGVPPPGCPCNGHFPGVPALTLSPTVTVQPHFLLPLGMALGQPVKMIGIRRTWPSLVHWSGHDICRQNAGFSPLACWSMFRKANPHKVTTFVNATGAISVAEGIAAEAAADSSATAWSVGDSSCRLQATPLPHSGDQERHHLSATAVMCGTR